MIRLAADECCRHEKLGKVNAIPYVHNYPEVLGVHESQHVCSAENFEEDYANRRFSAVV